MAWDGLGDSMFRAALPSLHARVAGTTPTAHQDDAFVQRWGPRFAAYVVPARDRRRAERWTPQAWPGAVLVDGEVVGTWRCAEDRMVVGAWRALPIRARDAVEEEAASLPRPGLDGPVTVRRDTAANA